MDLYFLAIGLILAVGTPIPNGKHFRFPYRVVLAALAFRGSAGQVNISSSLGDHAR